MSAAIWLKRYKIIEIRWFGNSTDFVSKSRYLIVYSFLILSQCKDWREWVIWEDLGALTTAQAREFWMS